MLTEQLFDFLAASPSCYHAVQALAERLERSGYAQLREQDAWALHHIKKENIGLIEVMGLAVLPSRLDRELALLTDAILQNRDLRADETLQKHAGWAEELKTRHAFTPENAEEILRQEVGAVFMQVLEDAGVYKCTPEGRRAFLRFVQSV